MNRAKQEHFHTHWAIQMQKSTHVFLQISPDISSQNIIAQNSCFYTVISLNIEWSHINFAIQFLIFKKNILYMFEKITQFCISICIMKLINQKPPNKFCTTQFIVPNLKLASVLLPLKLLGIVDQYSRYMRYTEIEHFPRKEMMKMMMTLMTKLVLTTLFKIYEDLEMRMIYYLIFW